MFNGGFDFLRQVRQIAHRTRMTDVRAKNDSVSFQRIGLWDSNWGNYHRGHSRHGQLLGALRPKVCSAGNDPTTATGVGGKADVLASRTIGVLCDLCLQLHMCDRCQQPRGRPLAESLDRARRQPYPVPLPQQGRSCAICAVRRKPQLHRPSHIRGEGCPRPGVAGGTAHRLHPGQRRVWGSRSSVRTMLYMATVIVVLWRVRTRGTLPSKIRSQPQDHFSVVLGFLPVPVKVEAGKR